MALHITAGLSVTVSAALAALPFLAPDLPIGPVLILNWVLFVSAGYLAVPRPITFKPPYKRWENKEKRIWLTVFAAFTIAGYLALLNAETMFEAGDLI